MKTKFLLSLIVAFFTITTASAQNKEFYWGGKLGLTMSNINSNYDGGLFTHLQVGGLLEYRFSDRFALGGELVYQGSGVTVGMKNKKNEIEANSCTLNYLQLPILARVFIKNGLSVESGIQFGALLVAKQKVGNSMERLKDIPTNKFDCAIPVGVAYDFSNCMTVGARYQFGLTKIIDGFSMKNNVFSLSVGVKL